MTSLTLYGYYRSSCTARLRIALNLKSLPYKKTIIDVTSSKHQSEEYIRLNPSRSVPTLIVGADTPSPLTITQSLAGLEFLEEYFPDSPHLLPPASDYNGRAQVRAMVNIIVADVQPITNLKTLRKVKSIGYDEFEWAREFTSQGLRAFEGIASRTAGKYSYGDQLSLADVCLPPAMWNAERFQVDLAPYPTVRRVYETLSALPEVRNAHWQAQEDCPDELRS
jgi:maleylacetoacetate isomerase